MSELAKEKCRPCEGGVEPLRGAELEELLKQLDGWSVHEERELRKTWKLDDFKALMAFVNRLADVAEGAGHHPDFCVHYNKLDVTLWTHAIGGLSQNDFIVAARLDALEA